MNDKALANALPTSGTRRGEVPSWRGLQNIYKRPHESQLYTLASPGSAHTILCLLCSSSLPPPFQFHRGSKSQLATGVQVERGGKKGAHPSWVNTTASKPCAGRGVTAALNELKAMLLHKAGTNFGIGDSIRPWDFYYLRGTEKFSGPPTLKTS